MISDHINQNKQIQMEIILTDKIKMYDASINFISLYNPKRIPTAIRI